MFLQDQIKISDKNHFPCMQPWVTNFVRLDGSVTCCTQNSTNIGNLNNQNIIEIWNSDEIKNVRKHISAGDYKKAGCDNECPFLRGSYNKVTHSPPSSELILPLIDYTKNSNTKYSKNINLVLEDYNEQKLEVKGLPVYTDVLWNEKCNAACIHCNQDHKSELKVSDKVKDALKERIPYSNYLRFQGGEVFMEKTFLDFFQEISRIKKYPFFKRYLITNGSFLNDRLIEKLLNNSEKLKILFSIDSVVKENFKQIRVNLKFERVVSAITKLANLTKQKKFDLTLNYCVMDKNLSELKEACNFAKAHNIKINFAAIQHDFGNVNFFYKNKAELKKIKNLLNDIKNYADKIKLDYSGFEGLIARLNNAISGIGYKNAPNKNFLVSKIKFFIKYVKP